MRTIVCGVLLLAAAIPASAANFSGKWAIQGPSGRGGGRREPTVLTLTQAGDVVTGTISVRIDAGTNSPVNDEVWGGKVDGETISFYVWTGTDRPVKTTYKGTMSPSGDEIAFSVTGASPPGAAAQPAAQQVTAMRTK